MDQVIYEHYNYFHDYDENRSYPFINWSERNKLLGGLWGCRVGASCGWVYITNEAIEKMKTLSAEEKAEIESRLGERMELIWKPLDDCTKFNFILKPWANNYIVTTFEDYKKLPKMEFEGTEVVDYVQCLRDGIDAIELCAIGDEYEDLSTQEDFDKLDEVFGVHWDCDSIVVLNKDAYEILDEAC